MLACLSVVTMQAQISSTNSTYSRFGLGLLNDQSNGFNKTMGGAGLGVRIGNRVNTVNPASYSAIDSLSLILDVGMRGTFGQMKQGSTKVGVQNASIDYVHAGMHIAKRLGLAIGFMPYTSIGYEFSSPESPVAVNPNTTQAITNSNRYEGSGGLNQAYIGLGWKVYRGLSVGANLSFMWGKYNHSLIPDFKEDGVGSTTAYSSTIKDYSALLKTYKIDLGVQYPVRLSPQDWLNLGASVGIGHKIAQDASLLIYTEKGDTTKYTASSPFDLPYSFGFGVSWQHKNTLLVAADAHYERWSDCRMPIETESAFVPMKGYYKDRTKIAVGTQWTPDPFGKYWERIQYRAGVNFSTPYLKVNNHNGPYELRMGVGAGLPITNKINNRSVVNVGVQWMRRASAASGMITEDYLLLNLGVTFNERWFVKYKIN